MKTTTKKKKGIVATNIKDVTIKPHKTIVLYKINDKIYNRKPRTKDKYIQFHVSSPNASLAKVKNFVKYVITDIKELNFLKNDMGFLMELVYGENHSTDLSINVLTGKIFYIWVYIPYIKDTNEKGTLPTNIHSEIFAFDIFYIRRHLSDNDCQGIQNILKRDIQANVFVRNINETPTLPFPITVTLI